MGKLQRERLASNCSSKVEDLLSSLLSQYDSNVIEVTMYWPPDRDQVDFLVGLDVEERDWDFTFWAKEWREKGQERDRDSELFNDLKSFFRQVWRDLERPRDLKGYLRLHDDIEAIDLANGRVVVDDDREDLGRRLEFSEVKGAPALASDEPEPIQLGDDLQVVCDVLNLSCQDDGSFVGEGVEVDSSLDVQIFKSSSTGITVYLEGDGSVRALKYRHPYSGKVGEFWLGLHVSHVHDIAGDPDIENLIHAETHRSWTYLSKDLKSSFRLEFDRDDKLYGISRVISSIKK